MKRWEFLFKRYRFKFDLTLEEFNSYIKKEARSAEFIVRLRNNRFFLVKPARSTFDTTPVRGQGGFICKIEECNEKTILSGRFGISLGGLSIMFGLYCVIFLVFGLNSNGIWNTLSMLLKNIIPFMPLIAFVLNLLGVLPFCKQNHAVLEFLDALAQKYSIKSGDTDIVL